MGAPCVPVCLCACVRVKGRSLARVAACVWWVCMLQGVHSLMRLNVVPRIPGASAMLFSLANAPIMYAAFMEPKVLDPVRPASRRCS